MDTRSDWTLSEYAQYQPFTIVINFTPILPSPKLFNFYLSYDTSSPQSMVFLSLYRLYSYPFRCLDKYLAPPSAFTKSTSSLSTPPRRELHAVYLFPLIASKSTLSESFLHIDVIFTRPLK